MSDQGKQVTADEWFNIVRDTVGPQGFLYGYSPAQDVVTSMRERTNLAAQETERKRRYEQFTREMDEQKQLDAVIEDTIRENPNISSAEIVGRLAPIYGPERIGKYAPRVDSVRQRVGQKDYLDGITLGNNFESVEEAESYIEANQAMTPQKKEAIRTAAKRKAEERERKNEDALWSAAKEFQTYGFDANDPATLDAIMAKLPPWLRRNREEAAANAVRVIDHMKGMVNQDARAFGVGINRGIQTRFAQGYTDSQIADTNLYANEEAERKKIEASMEQSDSAYLQQRSKAKGALIADSVTKRTGKNKVPPEVNQATMIATNALTDFEFSPEDEARLIEAVFDGPEKVNRVIAEAKSRAVPVASEIAVYRAKEAARYGIGLGKNSAQNYEAIIAIGDEQLRPMLSGIGTRLKQFGATNPVGVQNEMRDLSAKAAKWLAESRVIASRSNRVELSPENQWAIEYGMVYRKYLPFFEAYGSSEAARREFVQNVIAQSGPPRGIERRATVREVNAANSYGFYNRATGAPPGFGAGQGLDTGRIGGGGDRGGASANQWWWQRP
jgi:muconolactone delta-isomerase